VLNFGLAAEFGGRCHLRFDDTNPVTEETAFVEAIERDVRWLGADWGDHRFFASDRFTQLHDLAVGLIERGLAYVDHQSTDEIRTNRGDFHRPGVDSPYRDRSVAENLELFAAMRAGAFAEGECVLRARIDMRSPDLLLRDPLLYRIRHARHHRTGDDWPIYPMYDFAHPLCDALEGVTHSVCTLEFQNNRPLYDWMVANCAVDATPHQYEFARLNLSYTVLSKRKLQRLVADGVVDGWDDPRMPTIAGLRRRGYSPSAIRSFCETIGVARRDNVVDVALLEHTLREDLNATSPRYMAVLDPVRLVIDNWPAERTETFDAPLMPDDDAHGTRAVPFGRELWIERDDIRLDAPRKWHRLAPGREVRLRYACLITCTDIVTDPATGEITEVHATMDLDSLGGVSPDGRKVKGTIHWVDAASALDVEVRLYDRLFSVPEPEADADADLMTHVNPASLRTVTARCEPALAALAPGDAVQFERVGYFCADAVDSAPGRPVFNRTVGLRDTWARIERNA
jgi:glutaminyl-tRNA synthetase